MAKQPKTARSTKKRPVLLPVFMGILSVGMIINLIWPDRASSIIENRPLAHIPGMTLNTLADGSWMADVNDWFSDQFLGRSTFFHANYVVRKGMGEKEIQDVFLGRRALLGQNDVPEADVWQKNLEGMKLLAQRSELPSSIMIVPSAADVQTQKLPFFAPVHSHASLYQALSEVNEANVDVVDAKQTMEDHKTEYIYYNTDHHWTSYGAGLCAQTFFSGREEEMSINDFTGLQVSDSFQGTYASKTGSIGLSDDIFIYTSQKDPLYTVKNADGLSTSIYNKAALKQKDQYELFLGKNQALVQIETASDQLGKHLLIFKDSYANSLVQFLLPYYRTITILDPRYFYDDLDLILSSYTISEILYCFSADNIVSDSSLSNVLDTYELGLYPEEIDDTPVEPTAPSSENSEGGETAPDAGEPGEVDPNETDPAAQDEELVTP